MSDTDQPQPLRDDLAAFVEIDPTWTPGTLTRTERQAWAAGFRAAQRLVSAALDQDGQREAEGQRRAADVYIGTPRPVAETPIRVRTAAEREAWKAARDAAEEGR